MELVYRTGEKIEAATMRDRVERLRVWMVAGTALLVMAVAGFLGYQHYRAKAFLAGLPGRLGAEITRETNGYTYSQTMQGRTVFTLHAAKMEQRKDGVVRLHDVGVVLYGRKQDRADRIYGDEFEYDQEKGVVRALGVVHMDLQAPAPAEGSGKKQRPVKVTGGELAAGDPRVIHVMTSGLVYLTNLGVGATKEEIEFSEGDLKGTARGADYSSDTGVITLQSAVRVNGLAGGRPLTLTASRAELNQMQQTTRLAGARLMTGSETVEATDALVHVRKDGSPERIEGARGVVISREAGSTVMANEADASLNAAGKATALRLWGGVKYSGEDANRRTRGTAAEARVRFDAIGQPEHVTAVGDASVEEHESSPVGASSRSLTAHTVEVSLSPASIAGRNEVRNAEAIGAARLMVVDEVEARPALTEMTADNLKARFVGGRLVSNVLGTGHTALHQVDAVGVDEKSSGDTTELTFRASRQPEATVNRRVGSHPIVGAGPSNAAAMKGTAPNSGSRSSGQNDLLSAIQTGHVSMLRKSLTRQGNTAVETEQKATAANALYDEETDRVTLTGGVVLSDPESTIWAAKVVAERGTGNAIAEGGVRLSYTQAADGVDAAGKEREPVHVTASRAELSGAKQQAGSPSSAKGAQHAFFYGAAGKLARMWQGTSQVEAPVIEMEEGARRLTASGTGDAIQVHTTLVSTGDGKTRAGAGASAAVKRDDGPKVVRVLSRELVYNDATREAMFTGGVVVDDADGRMKAQKATVYLLPAKPNGNKATTSAGDLFSGGNVDRVVTTGKVELDQPGRHGTGEQLVYTAADGNFVLTGTAAAPPRVTDDAKGTVTGGALRFHSGDDSVEVVSEGIQSAGTGIKRRTETRVKQ